MSTIFYTVDMRAGFPVRFLKDGTLGHFPGPFADPGEASQEFVHQQTDDCEYIDAAEFDARAAGKRCFLDIIEQLQADNSEFDNALQEGYMMFYDRREERPAMTPAAIYAYFVENATDSPEWNLGWAAGWFCAFGENREDFYWTSCPPPAESGECHD